MVRLYASQVQTLADIIIGGENVPAPFCQVQEKLEDILRDQDAESWELREENRSLKDQLGTLSSTHAKDMNRLSDMIDKRETALGHIAAIMRTTIEALPTSHYGADMKTAILNCLPNDRVLLRERVKGKRNEIEVLMAR